VSALQQRPALAAQQQVQQPQRSGARSAVPPRPLATSASSSLGSSLARSTGSRSSSSAATRLAPVRARRERDPILAPMIQQDGPNGEVRPLLLLATISIFPLSRQIAHLVHVDSLLRQLPSHGIQTVSHARQGPLAQLSVCISGHAVWWLASR
jgi:hypothetical protein